MTTTPRPLLFETNTRSDVGSNARPLGYSPAGTRDFTAKVWSSMIASVLSAVAVASTRCCAGAATTP
jgi:hypothetical protein